MALCLSLAEMASIAPVSSAQYHFVAILAPARASRFLSWIAGMMGFKTPEERSDHVLLLNRVDHCLCVAGQYLQRCVPYRESNTKPDCAEQQLICLRALAWNTPLLGNCVIFHRCQYLW